MNLYVLPLNASQATLDLVGGKGASLARLANAGLPVPGGFHVTTTAYKQFVAENDLQSRIMAALEPVDVARPTTLETASEAISVAFRAGQVPPEIAGAIAQAYAELSGTTPFVAVRSSATAEDLPDLSFAGQQETFLNIQGIGAVLDAVKWCWASLWTARAIGYRVQHAIDQDVVSLAVVVQALVPAEMAGIMFTANPLNGRRDQAVINAAWGLGEAIVGGLVTPDTFTVQKTDYAVVSREIADKGTMTVRVNGGTHEQPVPDALRRAPSLGDAQVVELARLGTDIETLYGMPMDIEWCLADGEFFIVQARPITALPPEASVSEPEIEPPAEWPMPKPKGQYVRASIAELMPEPLTPLFGTLGRAAINAGTQKLMAKIGNMKAVGMEEMVVTINDYAYYTTAFTPRQLLMMLIHAPFTMPRMIRNAETYWREEVHVRYVETIDRWQTRPLEELSATDILMGVRQLAAASFDVYAAYQSALFARANLSEMLFTRVYDKLIKRGDDPEALIYLLGFESTPILAEESIYDIAEWCCARPALAAYVTETPAPQLAAHLEDPAPSSIEAEDWLEWQNRWDAHLQQFGHIIYDLDFAKPLPVDDPAPLLDTCKMFLGDQLPNPYERQRAAAERREQATQAMLERLKGVRRWLFDKLVHWAQDSVPLREEGLADLGLGYPQLRRMLRELGRRLSESGVLSQADDVFWLLEIEADQAAEALDRDAALPSFVAPVEQRKEVWRAEKRATPPPVLPPKSKWMGLDLGTFVAAEDAEQTGDIIKGAGTSPGRVTGTARVLRGPEDFDQMQPGDILVAKFTTPAWTPLFARAAAVVTDIGGQLSHGSIVAREYGIPAVMGTGVATRRIQSGQTIAVDGSIGEVMLHKSEAPQGPPAIEWDLPNPKGQYMHASIADLMPNPVSPLFETLAIPAIARVGVKEVLRPLTRSEPILPDYIVTLNSYVYINASYTLREWWWILTRMMLSMPRMLREAIPLWRDQIRPRYVATVARWQDRVAEALPLDELWAGIHELNDTAMLHFSSLLVATTGASAGAEMLFTRVYNKLIRRDGDPEATVFLMGYDSTPIQAEKSLYDLAEWTRDHPDLAEHILTIPTADLVAQFSDSPRLLGEGANRRRLVGVREWPAFCERLQIHLDTYGHIIYDLDFAKLLPLDDPTPMLETIKMYLRGEGTNPHERQQAAAERREQAVASTRARLKGLRRWAFDKTLKMGQSMAQVRENALADIGLGYPLLRALLHELGRRLVEVGTIQESADIFWLKADEVQNVVAALERSEPFAHLMESVAQRKAWHAALKQVTPPPMLPPRKKYMGIDMESFTPAAEGSQGDGALKGIGASAGQVTAPACVLHGPEDFDRMQPGCVLVAGTTTPAWTPLFAMASAVVTDVGGPLSHGSIVAREYGIPAVMGTGVATRRIQNGQTITVDGGSGIVTLYAG
jgi:pyruvate,water dikinase